MPINEHTATSSPAYVKQESYGTVTFVNEVIATIAGLAAVGIPGVAGMSGGMIDGIVEFLGRKNLSKGIHVTLGSNEVAVDAAIIAEYGSVIPQVAKAVQSSVTTAVESMTGLTVTAVNVRVQALSMNLQQESAVNLPQLNAVPAL